MKLCIGINSVEGSVLDDNQQAAIEDFCIDNAMEYIDFDQKESEQGLSFVLRSFLPSSSNFEHPSWY